MLFRRGFAGFSRSAEHLAYAVPDRMFIEVSGRDAIKFLQGIVTNDMSTLSSEGGSALACAFLTPKGRILADALCYNVSVPSDTLPEGPRLVLELHTSVHTVMLRHLAMHKLRSAVNIKPVDLRSFSLLAPAQAQGSLGATDGLLQACADPRGTEFGTRLLARPDAMLEGLVARASAQPSSLYEQHRLLLGLPDTPDIVGRIPLECNLDLLNYISFRKGCYVGQELTSRTKFRGLVRKRLLPYVVLGDAEESEMRTKPLTDEEDAGNPAGPQSRVPESVAESPTLELGLGFFPVDPPEAAAANASTATVESHTISASAATATAAAFVATAAHGGKTTSAQINNLAQALEAGATSLLATNIRSSGGRLQRVVTFRPPLFRALGAT